VREQILQVLDPDQRARFGDVMRPRAGQQPRGGGVRTNPPPSRR
jgi:hypothetical protein